MTTKPACKAFRPKGCAHQFLVKEIPGRSQRGEKEVFTCVKCGLVREWRFYAAGGAK